MMKRNAMYNSKTILFVSISFVLLIGFVFCSEITFAANVRAGNPYHIKCEAPLLCEGYENYYCTNCKMSSNAMSEQCPVCGRYWTIIQQNIYDYYDGDSLDEVLVKKYKSKHIVKRYYGNSDGSFDKDIVIKKPGKYMLVYYYTENGLIDIETGYQETDMYKEKEILYVLGKVIFNPNKGIINPKHSAKWKKQGSRIGKLYRPKRKGYTFQGWFTKQKGGKLITKKSRVHFNKKSKTYYAHWKKTLKKKK